MRTSARNQALWAELLLEALHEAGVRDVVLSPGSRSTPFVVAAEAHEGLCVHDVLDERVAGFFALGIGRAIGRPAVLLCTSGTAAAHYYPAVIEASAARVPLLVLSADRPLHLHGCGASQTVDQVRLFGEHARLFVDLGSPRDEEAALRALRRTAAQAVHRACFPEPCAVHLNARAEKPLEPPLDVTADERDAAAALRARLGPLTVVDAPLLSPSDEALDALEALVRGGGRGLLLAGPAPLRDEAARAAIWRLARVAGLPLLAESGSQVRSGAPPEVPVIGAVDTLLRASWVLDHLAPDFIVQLGPAPLAKGALGLLERHRGPLVVVSATGWPDPESRAQRLVQVAPERLAHALADRLEAHPPAGALGHRAWVEAWRGAERVAWDVAEGVLAGEARSSLVGEAAPDGAENGRVGGATLSEAEVARALVAALPPGALLALGNSLSIREVDGWAPPARHPFGVLTQRGASGIDGLVSGAAGAAHATRVPVALLLGDVSFLHDVGGLAVARRLSTPLCVVVVNNGGGRIFEQLPVGAYPEPYLRHFVTPTEADLGSLCRGFGATHVSVTDGAGLRPALAEALSRPGCTVVEALVPPHGALVDNRRAWAEVERRLRAMA